METKGCQCTEGMAGIDPQGKGMPIGKAMAEGNGKKGTSRSKAMRKDAAREQLRYWIGKIEYARYPYVRKGIMECTGITRNAWLNWSKGAGGISIPNMLRITWYAMTHDMPAPFDTVVIEDVESRDDMVCLIGSVKNYDTGDWETHRCMVL